MDVKKDTLNSQYNTEWENSRFTHIHWRVTILQMADVLLLK